MWTSNSCTRGFKFRGARPRFYDRLDEGLIPDSETVLAVSNVYSEADTPQMLFSAWPGLSLDKSIAMERKIHILHIILSYSWNVCLSQISNLFWENALKFTH